MPEGGTHAMSETEDPNVPIDPVRLLAAQRAAAEGARRLLADPIFIGAVDQMIADATNRAIFSDDKQVRSNNRHLVIALGYFRSTMQHAIDIVENRTAEEHRARSME